MVKTGVVAALVVIVVLAVAVSSAQTTGGVQKQGKSIVQKKEAAVYACSMHPEITARKAGTCTTCGMQLVAKPTPTAAGAAQKKAGQKKPAKHQHGGCGKPCGEPCGEPCGAH